MALDSLRYSFGITYRAMIFGPSKASSHLSKVVSALPLLLVNDKKELILSDSSRQILIFVCDFASSLHFNVVKRSLLRLSDSRAIKVIYCLNPDTLSLEQALCFHLMGAKFVCYGEDKDERLRDFLKSYVFEEKKESSALKKLEQTLTKAIKYQDSGKIKEIWHRLAEFKKDNSSVFKLKAKASFAFGKSENASIYLKRMLEANRQDLWAVSKLLKIYLAKNLPGKALSALEYYAEFGEIKNKFPDDAQFGKSLLMQSAFHSKNASVASFLQELAKTFEMKSNYNAAVYYYTVATVCSDKVIMQAKISYKIGLLYLKNNNLLKAKEFFLESVRLGGDEFNNALKPLERLVLIPSRSDYVSALAKLPELSKYDVCYQDKKFSKYLNLYEKKNLYLNEQNIDASLYQNDLFELEIA